LPLRELIADAIFRRHAEFTPRRQHFRRRQRCMPLMPLPAISRFPFCLTPRLPFLAAPPLPALTPRRHAELLFRIFRRF